MHSMVMAAGPKLRTAKFPAAAWPFRIAETWVVPGPPFVAARPGVAVPAAAGEDFRHITGYPGFGVLAIGVSHGG